MDAYEVLGLSKEPTDDDVRRAFRKMARDTHPDHQPASEQAAAELRMQQLNEARRRAMSDLGQRRARRTPPKTATTIAPVVPLQRDAAERARTRAVQELYRQAEPVVVKLPVPTSRTTPSWTVLLAPAILAGAVALALATGAPTGLVLALLAAIVIVSAVSLW